MSEKYPAQNATPPADLMEQLMTNTPKTELEHFAAREYRKLQQENKASQAKNDALVARVADLTSLLEKVISDSDIGVVPRSHLDRIEATLRKTESESLAEIQAEAVEDAAKVLPKNFVSKPKSEWTIDVDVLKKYANQLRQQGKDHD